MTLGAVTLTLAIVASQEPIEKRDFSGYPVDPVSIKPKREESVSKDYQSIFNEYLEETPIQHTQALEYLVKLLQSIDDAVKQLDCNIKEDVVQPKLPEKLELPQSRSSDVEADTDNNPISRRSFGGNRVLVPNNENDNTQSPWCSVALSCRKTMNFVCGYDDNFGYGKFDDICHMLQVNCYFKYNFALVPSCKPFL
ncbi:unnamed protein product [Euphydryas editha]|uniref:Uncharacterized protein n=1 Tax=Euphydryas editha TaxID=104508 RepID=A0AAU9UBA4_EUPED|nr:unnamed protein product [Euphydryas editha]